MGGPQGGDQSELMCWFDALRYRYWRTWCSSKPYQQALALDPSLARPPSPLTTPATFFVFRPLSSLPYSPRSPTHLCTRPTPS